MSRRQGETARKPAWVRRMLAALGLLPWGLLLAAVSWKVPRGFAVSHPRFWTLQVMPLGWMLVWLVGLLGVARRPRATAGAAAMLGTFAAGLGAHLALRFAQSVPTLAITVTMVGAWTLGWSLPLHRHLGWGRARTRAGLGVGLAVALIAGVGTGESLRAPAPSTRPSGPAPVQVSARHTSGVGAARMWTTREQHLSIHIDPHFEVSSRSPDRFWTALAPPETEHRSDWRVVGQGPVEDPVFGTASWWRSQDGFASVSVERFDRPLTIEARVRFDRPVYTHLATWSDVEFDARGRPLHLEFPGCPEPVEVGPSDYPEGRPVRFAYVDADMKLHVVEATSGEKGPYHALCVAALANDRLVIAAVSEGVRGEVVFHDFARQASTEPSPTAGWGVPQNAVQLMRTQGEQGPIRVLLSLAATGIGRGWDTVGITAGNYRNRIETRFVSR